MKRGSTGSPPRATSRGRIITAALVLATLVVAWGAATHAGTASLEAARRKRFVEIAKLIAENKRDEALKGFVATDLVVPLPPIGGKQTLADVLEAHYRDLNRRWAALDEITAMMPEAEVKQSLERFVGFGSRVLGYPGNAAAAEYIEQQFEAMKTRTAGKLEMEVSVDEFEAPVPMDRGARLELPGADADVVDTFTMYPLWPNLVRTPQLPRVGVEGHLVYLGRGTYAEMDGKCVDNAIALMDFNCEKYYLNVRDLGARAIVFIEPEDTDFTESSVKMLEVPVNVPRFWLKRADAMRLVRGVLTRQLPALTIPSGSSIEGEARKRGIDTEGKSGFDVMMALFGKVATGTSAPATVKAKAFCRMPWERVKGKNVYATIYGSDPELRKDVVVVQAFYDTISVVPSLAPGAESTGGIVGLLELAKVLEKHPPKRTVLLLATGSHFVSWEGIADWMLDHGPRGGTEITQEKGTETIVSAETMTLAVRIGAVVLTAVFVLIIVMSTRRIRYWHARQDRGLSPQGTVPTPGANDGGTVADDGDVALPEEGQGVAWDPARRASGLSSLRFVTAVFLIPVAVIAVLSNVESPSGSKTEHPIAFKHDAELKFFFSLDLSSASPDIGIFFTSPGMRDSQWDYPGKSHRTYMAQYAKRLMTFADAQETHIKLGVRVRDCVEPKTRDANDYVPRQPFLLDGSVILRTGNPCLSFMTIEDLRRRVDTPLDDLSDGRVNVGNLRRQLVAITSLICQAIAEEGFLKQSTQSELRDRVKQIETRVVEANYRESFVADTPVVDAVVVYKQGWTNWIPASVMNLSGVRGFRVCMTDERGVAVNRFIQAAGPTRITSQAVLVRPYKLSADDGRIIYAPDRGEQGDKSYPIQPAVSRPEYKHQVVAFQCEPLDLFHLNNARYLRSVGSGGAEVPIIFDVNDAAPQEFGYDMQESPNLRTGKAENCAVVYVKKAPPGTKPNRVKFLSGSVVFGLEYIATNTEEAGFITNPDGKVRPRKPEGIGHAAAGAHAVFRSALQACRDMIRIDQWRMDRFEKHGVVKPYREGRTDNQRLPEKHHKAIMHEQAATKALAEYRYHDGQTHLEKALGYEAGAYPDVKGTANDIVKGFMFYCILLLPFAFFCERLFFAFPDIRKQLFGFAAFFLVIFAIMAMVHPVFRITDAPYVILLAFVILVLAMAVLFIIIAKFNEQMAKMRRKASKVHEADVGRLSASGTAVMLGISNMKKRKVRTTLTTVTLILLTFTVMSFTSVTTETVYNEIPQSHKAPYEGLLLRDRTWNAQEPPALDQFRRQFESVGGPSPAGAGASARGGGKVIPRAWVAASSRGSKNFKFVLYGSTGAEVDCQGVVGFMPEETRALMRGLKTDKVLVAGRWFDTSDEKSVILPSHVAYKLLEFTADNVTDGTAFVRMRGMELQLVGVLDSARLDQLRDLDDESYTPIDLETKSAFGEKLKGGHFTENIIEIVKLPHLATASIAIVPYEVCREMGGRIASAAVVFDEDYDFEPDLKDFLERVGMTIFAGHAGQAKAYSSIAMSQIGDMGNLFVPILIAALIVLNTMMGSVHERAHEIGIYSSVGLAPVHIAALFLAESCVYAVMGAISGYLLGTVVGHVVSGLGISKLTLNYSSLSAVFSTLVVMATVILSTLYPAKMAANMSVPDVTRQWKFPDPEGDVWKFDFPFTVASQGVLGLFIFLDNYFDAYKEESIGSFYADHIRVYAVDDVYGLGYVVELDCWLAPFDLSVSQNVQLRALPTEDEGITRIEMLITRLSGEVSNWMRLNRGFLTLMRKQFLIWRTVPAEVKEEYRLEGEARLKNLQGAANV